MPFLVPLYQFTRESFLYVNSSLVNGFLNMQLCSVSEPPDDDGGGASSQLPSSREALCDCTGFGLGGPFSGDSEICPSDVVPGILCLSIRCGPGEIAAGVQAPRMVMVLRGIRLRKYGFRSVQFLPAPGALRVVEIEAIMASGRASAGLPLWRISRAGTVRRCAGPKSGQGTIPGRNCSGANED